MSDGPADAARRLDEAAGHVRGLLGALGLDLDDPDLRGTPDRVARLYADLLAAGPPASPALSAFPNTEGYRAVVSVRDIPFYSLCAHHLLPFFGQAHVAYLPAERIAGLGSLARLVEDFAHRPQLQERLTEQVVDCLERELRPVGAMVVLEARHLCVEMRGVRKPGLLATTSAVRGRFEEPALRDEFLGLLHRR